MKSAGNKHTAAKLRKLFPKTRTLMSSLQQNDPARKKHNDAFANRLALKISSTDEHSSRA